MAQYVKCCGCQKPIKFGEKVYVHNHDGYTDLYHSAECFVASTLYDCELDYNLADVGADTVYDTEAIRAEIASLQDSIERQKNRCRRLYDELQSVE